MWKSIDSGFTRISTWIAAAAGQPAAFVLALLIVLFWGMTGPIFHYSETWQLVINTGTTIVTFLMVFLIQNSQNRDTASMQAKLDELLYALDGAREQFIGIEHLSEHEIQKIRFELEQEVKTAAAPKSNESVDHLLKRL